LTAILVIAACGADNGEENDVENRVVEIPACTATDDQLQSGATLDGFAGTYQLTMVATAGENSGQQVEGRLELVANEGSMRQFTRPGGATDPATTVPLYGTTDIAVEDVGALRLGDLGSRDPLSPGALVLESRRETGDGEALTITLRLGSLSNRRDRTLFDGGFTAFDVHSVTENGFWGEWASGARGRDAEGYFCAFRIGG
jgi:hypothetical protein